MMMMHAIGVGVFLLIAGGVVAENIVSFRGAALEIRVKVSVRGGGREPPSPATPFSASCPAGLKRLAEGRYYMPIDPNGIKVTAGTTEEDGEHDAQAFCVVGALPVEEAEHEVSSFFRRDKPAIALTATGNAQTTEIRRTTTGVLKVGSVGGGVDLTSRLQSAVDMLAHADIVVGVAEDEALEKSIRLHGGMKAPKSTKAYAYPKRGVSLVAPVIDQKWTFVVRAKHFDSDKPIRIPCVYEGILLPGSLPEFILQYDDNAMTSSSSSSGYSCSIESEPWGLAAAARRAFTSEYLGNTFLLKGVDIRNPFDDLAISETIFVALEEFARGDVDAEEESAPPGWAQQLSVDRPRFTSRNREDVLNAVKAVQRR